MAIRFLATNPSKIKLFTENHGNSLLQVRMQKSLDHFKKTAITMFTFN